MVAVRQLMKMMRCRMALGLHLLIEVVNRTSVTPLHQQESMRPQLSFVVPAISGRTFPPEFSEYRICLRNVACLSACPSLLLTCLVEHTLQADARLFWHGCQKGSCFGIVNLGRGGIRRSWQPSYFVHGVRQGIIADKCMAKGKWALTLAIDSIDGVPMMSVISCNWWTTSLPIKMGRLNSNSAKMHPMDLHVISVQSNLCAGAENMDKTGSTAKARREQAV
eukprot:1155662-Pelagomonas_calceolata.AAC.2